jgi:colanic acid/amylovoran biosynthesis glycosyltransferase
MTATALIYLDTIGVPSEVSFLKRFYGGFTRLAPTWISWSRDTAADALSEPQIMLGRAGLNGVADRLLFKTTGKIPPVPDLAPLKPQIIHAHFGRGGALALPLARALKVPLVVTFHGGDATKDKHYREGLVSTIYQRRLAALQAEAVGFHCVSGYIRDALIKRGFPAEKLFVLHTGVEPTRPAADVPPHAAPYVLFVGRLVEKKGVDSLIAAVRLLQQQGTSVPLVIIGDGPLRGTLVEQAQGLADVRFLGWQPNHEVRHWMRGAMAVCVPSRMAETGDSEGLGHVVLEAMEAGAPVVASRHGGIQEVVEDGVTGLLTAPGDAGSIAAALGNIVAAPDLRRLLGERGRALVAKQFDAVTQSRLLEDRFLALIARNS